MEYREWYAYGVRELEEAGIEEAALDARLLLEYVCHTGRNDLLAHGDREVGEEEGKVYMDGIARRRKHEPLQYITGEQDFMGLTFLVDRNVLVPRQDTEILVEEAMRFLHDGMDVLDMCTGYGCILLSLLHYSNGCHGLGVDISRDALAVAERNRIRLQKKERAGNLWQDGCNGGNGIEETEPACRFLESDLFEKVSGRFDLIVSNPPYIPADELSGLMEEVGRYEPRLALDGKEDGLSFYHRIVAQAGDYLRGGGALFFEVGCGQAEAVKGMMEKEGYRDITVVKDYAGIDRVVYGWKWK